jgi:hypothetical protein
MVYGKANYQSKSWKIILPDNEKEHWLGSEEDEISAAKSATILQGIPVYKNAYNENISEWLETECTEPDHEEVRI